MITQVKIYLDEDIPILSDIVRCKNIILQDENGKESCCQNFFSDRMFYSRKELIDSVANFLGVDFNNCRIVENVSYEMLKNIIKGFDNIFLKEGNHNLGHFLDMHKKTSAWIIASDYCIKNKKKKNSIACFAIIPYIAPLDMIKDTIEFLAPKDIKGTKNISKKFIKFLRSGAVYNVCVNLKKFNALVPNREIAHKHLDDIIALYRSFIAASENKRLYFENVIKDIKMLKEEIKKKSFNKKLISHMIVISFIVAYLAKIIMQQTEAQDVSWFPDRDDITNSYNMLACNLFHAQCYSICGYFNIDMSNRRIGIATQNSDELWFDSLIRIPDYIAGSFADFDYENNKVSSKHMPMIEDFAADNPYLVVFEYGLEEVVEYDNERNADACFTKIHLKLITVQKS